MNFALHGKKLKGCLFFLDSPPKSTTLSNLQKQPAGFTGGI
jgi:hypothetical protein